MAALSKEQLRVGPRDHVVQFYRHDDELIDEVGDYLTQAIGGGVAVVIATPAHQRAFEQRLSDAGIDVASARDDGAYLDLDAGEQVARFAVDGRIDAAGFEQAIGQVMRDACAGGRPVRAYGEMVALLWETGLVNAAIEVEALWNDLGRESPFSLFCAYPAQSVEDSGRVDAFNEMCVQHAAVVGTECNVETRAFALTPDAPALARHFAIEALERLGAGRLADDAALIVTELAANAALHARSAFTVALSTRGDTVRISVRDERALPETAALVATPMHGLGLVATIASSWGVISLNGGKTIWAELT